MDVNVGFVKLGSMRVPNSGLGAVVKDTGKKTPGGAGTMGTHTDTAYRYMYVPLRVGLAFLTSV